VSRQRRCQKPKLNKSKTKCRVTSAPNSGGGGGGRGGGDGDDDENNNDDDNNNDDNNNKVPGAGRETRKIKIRGAHATDESSRAAERILGRPRR